MAKDTPDPLKPAHIPGQNPATPERMPGHTGYYEKEEKPEGAAAEEQAHREQDALMIKRDDLGPTGPAKLPKEGREKSYDEKHPHAGNVGDKDHVGPTPTDDPDDQAAKLKKTLDKKRAQTPAD